MDIRALEVSDYHQGFFELLQQLTTAPKPTQEVFCNALQTLSPNELIFVAVEDGHVIGTIKLILETKFIHSCQSVLHIEDLVVDSLHRQRGIASTLLTQALLVARRSNIYKVILNCSPELQSFYSKFGFSAHGLQMALYNKEVVY